MAATVSISKDHDASLFDFLASCYADPCKFVAFAFDWDHNPALQVVPCPEPWKSRYGLQYGPDRWQWEILEQVGAEVRKRKFNGKVAVPPIQVAISSGHGIGKSAFTGMLVTWLMATRPDARGMVTANTAPQLRSKTWAQICSWMRRSIVRHLFEISDGGMWIRSIERPGSWKVEGYTCAPENAEAFQGLHNATSTAFMIFDEASAIDKKIWDAAHGAMTDGEPHWYVFGNPTRVGTEFHRCFTNLRHRWITRQIDSRDCYLPNKEEIRRWIEDEGDDDTDFIRVRVKGEFPRQSIRQLIPYDIVNRAMRGEPTCLKTDPLVVGLDIARGGDAETVFCFRRGRDARTRKWIHTRERDTMQIASMAAQMQQESELHGFRIHKWFPDGVGVGGPVIDRMRQLGMRNVVEVRGGDRARSHQYRNLVTESWCLMRDWLREGGKIPHDPILKDQLTTREYFFDPQGRLYIEPKDKLTARGMASPDRADALALTFAYPVLPLDVKQIRARRRRKHGDWDPWED